MMCESQEKEPRVGDYMRSTRECAFGQLRPELVQAIRDYLQKHELGTIEADISRVTTQQDGTPTDLDVSVMPFRARLAYNIPIGGYSRLAIGAGYVRTRLGDFYDNSESGITGLAGLKIGMGEHFILRLDGTMDWMTGSLINDLTVDRNINCTYLF